MAEYIDREAAIKMMRGSAIAKYPLSFSFGILAAADELQNMPDADVAPVVHGRWVEKEDMIASYLEECTEVFYECSACKSANCLESPYCPNCGARMDL